VKILTIENRGVKGTKRGSEVLVAAPVKKARDNAGAISTAASSSSGGPAPVSPTPEPPSDIDTDTDSSSDSSSSSKHRSKRSKKKSKKDSKTKKQSKKAKKAARKQEKRDNKALLTETGPEKKARMALAKARDQASAKVHSSKKKVAEQMIGKLATALAGVTSTVGKDTFCFIPDMIKDPMMDAFTELQGISAAACLIVQSEGKSDEENPDPKAGISDISQSIERVIANTLSSEPSLHIVQRAIATHWPASHRFTDMRLITHIDDNVCLFVNTQRHIASFIREHVFVCGTMMQYACVVASSCPPCVMA
jgi:hypothetical protein